MSGFVCVRRDRRSWSSWSVSWRPIEARRSVRGLPAALLQTSPATRQSASWTLRLIRCSDSLHRHEARDRVKGPPTRLRRCAFPVTLRTPPRRGTIRCLMATPRRHLSMLRSYTAADALTVANAACGTICIFLCLDYIAADNRRFLWTAFLLPAARARVRRARRLRRTLEPGPSVGARRRSRFALGS